MVAVNLSLAVPVKFAIENVGAILVESLGHGLPGGGIVASHGSLRRVFHLRGAGILNIQRDWTAELPA